jgi:hypothetical protein
MTSNATEIFTTYSFMDKNAKPTDFANCSIVMGTLGEQELGWPIPK